MSRRRNVDNRNVERKSQADRRDKGITDLAKNQRSSRKLVRKRRRKFVTCGRGEPSRKTQYDSHVKETWATSVKLGYIDLASCKEGKEGMLWREAGRIGEAGKTFFQGKTRVAMYGVPKPFMTMRGIFRQQVKLFLCL